MRILHHETPVFRDPAFEAEYRDEHPCMETLWVGATRADTEDLALAGSMRRASRRKDAPYDGDSCCRLGEIDGRHEPDNRYCLGRYGDV